MYEITHSTLKKINTRFYKNRKEANRNLLNQSRKKAGYDWETTFYIWNSSLKIKYFLFSIYLTLLKYFDKNTKKAFLNFSLNFLFVRFFWRKKQHIFIVIVLYCPLLFLNTHIHFISRFQKIKKVYYNSFHIFNVCFNMLTLSGHNNQKTVKISFHLFHVFVSSFRKIFAEVSKTRFISFLLLF